MITLKQSVNKRNIFIGALALLVTALFLFTYIVRTNNAQAVSGADWSAGNIIDDSIFYNGNDMSVDQIQSFLNQKLPSCDTNGTKRSELGGGTRAQYAASKGYSLPIICTKEYYENPDTKANNLGTGVRPPGSISAAQIIKNAAVQYGVGTKVLLVILEKEMSLVTDDWPLPNSYRKAMGFGCPDTAPCDAQYYGFSNQVSSAARQYVIYKNNPNSYRHVAGKTNPVLYNPTSSCGNSGVYISSTATAGLYNYTPYQPNQAALNNLYGTGDGCSAYGNRNFWTMYSNMFGSTSSAPTYGYAVNSKELYSDAAFQNRLSSTSNIEPGSNVYVKLSVKNTGNQTWYKNTLSLGTKNPIERISEFYADTWISRSRIGTMNETTVTAGNDATFSFKMKAPNQLGSYSESFGVLIEGLRWFDGSVEVPVTVQTSAPYYSAQAVSFDTYKDSARTQKIDPTSISLYTGSKIYAKVVIKNVGNQILTPEVTKLATTEPVDRTSAYTDSSWINQNRVTTAQEGQIKPNEQGTYLFSFTAPSSAQNRTLETFGIVMEGQRWINYNIGAASIQTLTRPSAELQPNQQLDTNQSLLSYDERYQLVMQADGNLVLYSPNRALWASGTSGKGGARAVMQADGNLVIYRSDWTPIWSSNTSGNGPSKLMPQVDGNLVLYTNSWKATWSSRTSGN